MKLNNKGMTLAEILVSIVLVGLVLTFLFQLLSDLHNETDNNSYAYNNQVNRTEAIYTIQKDLLKYTLVGIEDASNSENLVIKFYYENGASTKTATLESASKDYEDDFGDISTKYYLRYTSYSGEKYSWEMKNALLDTCGNYSFYYDSNSAHYYFKLIFPVYNAVENVQNNQDKNNAVDDIELAFSGSIADIITTNGSYNLTNGIKTNEKIGTCAN